MSESPLTVPDGGDDYWVQARRPLHCLFFLLPLLAVYEAGVLKLAPAGGSELRNGADYWLREGLRYGGLEQPWLLPAVVLGLLLGWQLIGRYRWGMSPATLIGMTAESLLFGVCLIVLGQLQDLAFRQPLGGVTAAIRSPTLGEMQRAIGYIGAGIYEEVLFRLLLLPFLYGFFRLTQLPRQVAIVMSIGVTSLLFAGAHYVGPAADPWSVYSFTFRAVAGGFFALLFVLRGFGITVGAHAAYDLLVGVLLPAASMSGSLW